MDSEPSGLSAIVFLTKDLVIVLNIITVVVLLGISAMISGAEVAFFSLSRAALNQVDATKSKTKQLISKLLEKPKKLLATILIVNNFVNIGIIILSTYISAFLLKSVNNPIVAFLLQVVLITFLILFFGEVLPKVYAARHALQLATIMARPLSLLNRMFSFLSVPLITSSTFIENRLAKKKTNISVGQLSQALELTSKKNTTKEEQKILQGIVSFGSTETRQVMCSRVDIFAVSDKMSYKKLIQELIKSGFSRIPVYKENIDTIIGVLYVKDLLPHLDKTDFNWVSLIRTPYFVPENKKLDDLLNEFQEKKIHLAIVVDEYGGTSGIVSLEDIIEEIVGDISDEFDDEGLMYSKLDATHYVFEGKTSLKDFYRVTGIDSTDFESNKGEADTLAGFVLEIAGNFPKKNEKVPFKNHVFTVEALDRRRLKQIKISLDPQQFTTHEK